MAFLEDKQVEDGWKDDVNMHCLPSGCQYLSVDIF